LTLEFVAKVGIFVFFEGAEAPRGAPGKSKKFTVAKNFNEINSSIWATKFVGYVCCISLPFLQSTQK